jgi:hypothetical protein
MSRSNEQKMCLSSVNLNEQQSLTDHAIDLQLSHNVEIHKQSLHEKFTPQAVYFIKSLISEQFSKQVALPLYLEFQKERQRKVN